MKLFSDKCDLRIDRSSNSSEDIKKMLIQQVTDKNGQKSMYKIKTPRKLEKLYMLNNKFQQIPIHCSSFNKKQR